MHRLMPCMRRPSLWEAGTPAYISDECCTMVVTFHATIASCSHALCNQQAPSHMPSMPWIMCYTVEDTHACRGCCLTCLSGWRVFDRPIHPGSCSIARRGPWGWAARQFLSDANGNRAVTGVDWL